MLKRIACLLCLKLIPLAVAGDAIVVATYNIRYKNPEDVQAGNGWDKRREHVRNLILFHGFDVVGMQEVVPAQLPDVVADLEAFDHVGELNNDGKAHGSEYVPIFYRRDRFERIESGTFWLSATPDTGSVGWDALYLRICTWVKLGDRRTGKIFQVWNTHFDHRGREARTASAELLLERLEPAISRGELVVVMGDFNFTRDRPGYAVLTRRLADSRDRSELPAYGPAGTTNGFNYTGEFRWRIDHIFITDGIRVLRHGTLTDSYDHRFPSDHFPVVTELVLTH